MANLTAAYAGDWQVIDDTVTVTLFVRSNQANSFQVSAVVPNCWRTAVDKDEQAQAPELLAEVSTAWHLWLSQIPQNPPITLIKVGDVIFDGTFRWTVKSVRVCDEGQRFRCAALKER